ncbi:S-layer homology domain-containing protein [Paenibacillaceae bacterium]|nr:S-layer homology domain-containing protein [Paenibacillaceae bacterium]
MKKIIASAVLSIALITPLAGNAFAAVSFTDLAGSAASAQIEALKEKGIVSGVTATTFKPAEELTASQGISLIVKGAQLSLAAISFNKAPTAEGYFKSVSNDAWYAESFIIAKANGLNIPEDIDPSAKLTKEDYVALLVQGMERGANLPMLNLKPVEIADEDAITVTNQGAIQRALHYKLLVLDESGSFNPKETVTREEAAAILYNAVEYLDNYEEAQQQQSQETTDNVTEEAPQTNEAEAGQ